MTANEMRPYQRRLRRLSDRLSGNVARLEVEALGSTGADAADRPVDTPAQEDDLPAHREEEDVALALLGNEGHILKEVQDALDRIERNTFGRCETCGHPIPHVRLDAIPYARHCVHCAADIEQPARR